MKPTLSFTAFSSAARFSSDFLVMSTTLSIYGSWFLKVLFLTNARNEDLFRAARPHLEHEKIKAVTDINGFHELYSARVFGYNSAREYYDVSSCVRHLDRVRLLSAAYLIYRR